MSPTATAAPAAVSASGSGQKAQAMPARPFRVGVQEVDDVPYDNTLVANNTTQDFQTYELPSTGFINKIMIWVTNLVTGNTNTTVSFSNEGPFNCIDTIQFLDTNNQPIFGPVTGWDMKIIEKWGGYAFSDDPQGDNTFTVLTGAAGVYTASWGYPVSTATSGTANPLGIAPAVGNAGSFQWIGKIPLELCSRDGLGSLPNKSASTPFKIKVRLAASTTAYLGAAPNNGTNTYRLRMIPESYWQPATTDAQGNSLQANPPAVDTTQYWQKGSYGINAGTVNTQLTGSTGFPLRNLLFYLFDSANNRFQGEADWPDPLTLQLEANILRQRNKTLWQSLLSEDFDYSGAVAVAGATTGAPEAANAKEAAVYALPFNKDFGAKPGWETRRGYLPTTDGMRLQFRGTVGGAGAHTLNVLTNFVAPGAGATLASITA
jgi:hypothetical protein